MVGNMAALDFILQVGLPLAASILLIGLVALFLIWLAKKLDI